MTRKFATLTDFCRHLETVAVEAEAAQHRALQKAAEVVQHAAREKIGEYQAEAGSFAAWDPLAEPTLNGFNDHNGHHPGKIELGFSPPDNPLLRNGELRDAIEITASAREAIVGVPGRQLGDGSVANPARDIGDVAAWQEFGTMKMPPRSFLGAALFQHSGQVADLIGQAVAKAIAGELPGPSTKDSE